MPQSCGMDYIIGAGAVLESGEDASITPATLHAHVDPVLAAGVQAAAIDFESANPGALRRLVVMNKGWNAAQFRDGVSEPLRQKRDCSLADVLRILAQGAGTPEVHVFAHWLPDVQTCSELAAAGIAVIAHPLESIAEASLVSGQRRHRWHAA